MPILRRIPTHSIQVFRDLFTSAWLFIKSVCRFDQLHVVFDSYLEDSIKGSERSRRNKLDPLDFFGITLDTKFPVQVDRFWVSIHNKEQLQILSRIFLKQVAEKEHVNMVLSGYVDHEKKTVLSTDLKLIGMSSKSVLKNFDLAWRRQTSDLFYILRIAYRKDSLELSSYQMTLMLLCWFSTTSLCSREKG